MKLTHLAYVWTYIVYSVWTFLFSRVPGDFLWLLGRSSGPAKWREMWAPRFEFGPLVNKSLTLAVTPDGTKFYCPASDASWLVREIYIYKVYDQFSEFHEGQTIIDVGAHVGLYALKAAKKVGSRGRVIAIEPNPYTYEILLTNMKMNNLQRNVIPINIAIANVKGKMGLYLDSKSHMGHSFLPVSRRHIEVEVDKLDTVIKKLGLKQCDLIKIDVEGYESEVLKSAEDTLKCTQAVVVAAYHAAGEEEAVKCFLKSHGFNVFSELSYVYAQKPEVKTKYPRALYASEAER